MSDEIDLHAEYLRATDGLDVLGATLHDLIAEVLRNEDIPIHTIDYRVKSEESALQKIERKPDRYTSVSDITDLLGIRITCYFSDQVSRIAKRLDPHFAVVPEHSSDKHDLLGPTEFGYLSVHLVATITDSRAELVEYARHAGKHFEIQIRSVLQHAWAEIEHDLGYKAETIPKQMRRRFSILSGVLEMVDQEFISLRKEITEYEGVAKNAATHANNDLLFDQASVTAVLEQSAEFHSFDKDLAEIFSRTLQENVNPRYVERRVVEMQWLGISDIKTLQRLVREWRRHILEFTERWHRDRDIEVDTARKSLPRGVLLYYLRLAMQAELLNLGLPYPPPLQRQSDGFRRDLLTIWQSTISEIGAPPEIGQFLPGLHTS